jgi:hypothetical protein
LLYKLSFVCRFVLIPASFDLFAEIFPEFQERAEAAVAKLRVENPAFDVNPPWTTEDHLTALSSRITHMNITNRLMVKLSDAAIQAFKCLWPEEAVPESLGPIADRLLESGKRHEWQRSAARAGADTALRFVCSWYEALDLDTLHSMRGDAPTDTDPEKTAKRRDRAYRIAHYA